MNHDEDLEARLAKAKAARAELARAREEREERAAKEERVAAEERAVRNEEAIAKAVEEHGPVGRTLAVVDTDLGVVIVKRPHQATFRKFQDAGSTKTAAVEQLVRPCVVHPSPDQLDRILDELPATLIRLADAVCTLAGMRREEVAGK